MGAEALQVFGGDWPTPDGTGVRDYIHVMDLAEGHRAALDTLLAEEPQLLTVNLAAGRGHSVLEVVQAFEAACGHALPVEIVDRAARRRGHHGGGSGPGAERLGWRTRRGLAEICRDGWPGRAPIPRGYGP